MTDKPVRLRFAPSPTGSLHIGGVRLALFNWLYVRKHGGIHILRIEDTDQKRYVPESVRGILDAFEWFGFEFDEGPHVGGDFGPYVQSERREIHQKWANWLVEQGHAYRAYETPEELSAINEERQKKGLQPGYDGRSRNLTQDQIAQYESENRPYVIRFKMPLEGKTIAEDMIRGKIEVENAQFSDPVLLKSDGFPTYHLAVVVDDHLMQISHVTRGVEWLPSLPIHWNIWEAFGWEKPIYAHMPLILKPSGKGKLSKREPVMQDGTRIPSLARDFIEDGYLPESTMNFLINIGWNFGDDREIFTFEEAIERFDLADVNKANGAYPIKKLDAINAEYIRAMDVPSLVERLHPVLENAGLPVNQDLLLRITPAIQTRIKTLNDAIEMTRFLFVEWETFQAPEADLLIQKKMTAEDTVRCLEASVTTIESLEDFTHDSQYARFKELAQELNIKNGQLFGSLRVAVTGQRISPPTFESMEALGKEESLRRIDLSLQRLKENMG